MKEIIMKPQNGMYVFIFAWCVCLPHAFGQLTASQNNPSRTIKNNFVINSYQITVDQPAQKSVPLAIGLSLILPGMGELYAGNFSAGKYHLIADAGLWITFASLRIRSKWLRDDIHSFGTEHAGANFNNKNTQYDVDIGNFLSTEDYNNVRLHDREFDLLYTDPAFHWQWDSDANRIIFKDRRMKSDAAFNNSKFIIGLMVINRIISAFRAGRSASVYNSSLTDIWDIKAYPFADAMETPGIAVQFSISF